jgi:hypothetical protein
LLFKPPYYPGTTRTGALPTDIIFRINQTPLDGQAQGLLRNLNNLRGFTPKMFVTPVVLTNLEGANTIIHT